MTTFQQCLFARGTTFIFGNCMQDYFNNNEDNRNVLKIPTKNNWLLLILTMSTNFEAMKKFFYSRQYETNFAIKHPTVKHFYHHYDTFLKVFVWSQILPNEKLFHKSEKKRFEFQTLQNGSNQNLGSLKQLKKDMIKFHENTLVRNINDSKVLRI